MAGNLRLLQIDKSKRAPGKTAIDVFVVNQTNEHITVYPASATPHIYQAVQIKQLNGKVFRLIEMLIRPGTLLFLTRPLSKSRRAKAKRLSSSHKYKKHSKRKV